MISIMTSVVKFKFIALVQLILQNRRLSSLNLMEWNNKEIIIGVEVEWFFLPGLRDHVKRSTAV